MRPVHAILASLAFAIALQPAVAQSVSHLSVPAAAFQGEGSSQNESGTARFLRTLLYAPVDLPHGSTVTSLSCGAKAPFRQQIVIRLRRNDPQQANVDVATTRTTLSGTGFQFVSSDSITSGTIDNSRFNYYLVADVDKPGGNKPGNRAVCTKSSCSVGFCRIQYRSPPPTPTLPTEATES